ncbi:fibronectin type III domain-containing protein [Chitinophaga sp. NPDC101104]|uniref:fibronectin type III domain-containing protein n=1 Tax=Chitinophaga sp. NPDC101104 TaxID=3390561 RepID=UPI003D05173D
MRQFYLLLLACLLGFAIPGSAQVFNPADPVITYNPNDPPETPAWGTISKWVRTVRSSVNFTNKDSYKCYYLSGMPFRLKYPKTYQHGVSDGKKYPIFIFFHGRGEGGGIYDNEYSLYHGGGKFCAAVDNGKFDGFILVPQSTTGFFGQPQYDFVKQIIDELKANNKLDPDRIFVNGLSAGGTETWEFMFRYPKEVAGFLPISGCSIAYRDQVNVFKNIPLWIFQGGLDNNPHPSTTTAVITADQDAGGNAKMTLYPNGGHGIWNTAWDEADFWPFIGRQHKANPWPAFGHNEFCPGETVSVVLGLTPGFDGYEWRKNGNVIAGATTYEYTATEFGTYDARIKRGTEWSPWSPTPVVVKQKEATQTPPLSIAGLMSKVIPAVDGKNYVVLTLPEGYTSYQWRKVGDPAIIGTAQTQTVNTPGQYQANVTEKFGCSSEWSAPFTIIPANGPNPPAPASGLTATAISKTAITIDWTDNPNAVYNETGYEVYRSNSAGANYQLIAITAPNAATYTDNNLSPNTKYYYVLRAVNTTAASAISNEATATTQVDNNPPSAPSNLAISGTSTTSVKLTWGPSYDDVGVFKYDIYVNSLKSYTVDATEDEFTVFNLKSDSLYTFVVKARDLAGNTSTRSNQVSTRPVANGLNYRYYEGNWSVLPDFNTLTPIKTGISEIPDLSVRNRNDQFGFVWEGQIRIPVTGNYTFVTTSDDGSKLWIDTDYDNAATPLVNNDGLHGTVDKEGTKYLTAGMHKIAIAFFEQGGGESMTVSWKNTAGGVGSTKQTIPAEYFKDLNTAPGGTVPKAPGNIKATALSYNKIQLTWSDSSNNETGFEIYRAESAAGPFSIVNTAAANKVAYLDSGLNASTAYYYRIQAINKYGASGFHPNETGGFSYSAYNTATNISSLPNFNTSTPVKTGLSSNVTLDVRQRDDAFALKFSGWINIPTTGTYTFYTNSDDGSKLYIGNYSELNLVVSNDHQNGPTEKSGTKLLTAGKYQIHVTYYDKSGNQTLTTSYAGPGVSKRLIPDSMYVNKNATAKTLAMPAIPAAPTALALTALSGSSIQLKWNDNSTTETAFDLYRSANDASNFRLFTSIPANAGSEANYTDTGLFANVTYYYKVLAKNEGGSSAFSNTASKATLNTAPALTPLENRSVRYGTQLVLALTATDPDGETVTITSANVPAFGQFNTSGGTATLTFNPTQANEGVYNNITVTATDQHGGVTNSSFNLTVNDNYSPVIGAVSNVSLNENATANVALSATDNNAGETVTWSATGLPAFATLTPSGNSASIALAPGFIDAGTYAVTVKADDGRGGIDTKSFTITVNDVNPSRTIFVNFTDGSYPAPAPWNNTNKQPVLNDLFANLKDNSGATTTVGIRVTSNWGALGNGSNYFGTTTGNNSGVYPDNVMKTAYWSNTTAQTFKLVGLNATSKYNLTFFGARADVTDNRMTDYTVGGTTVSLQAAKNTQNTVSINNISPDANNEILITMKNGTGSSWSYINALVIQVNYDDGNAPAKPTQFAATPSSGGVVLSWKDVAFNEAAYEVYRASAPAGPFTLLNPAGGNANATSFTDATSVASTQYYYTLRAVNEHGPSGYTDTIGILTGNNNPKFDSIGNVSIKNNETFTIPLHATDDAGDVMTLRSTNLPPFATLTDNGDGTGSISIVPSSGDVGRFANINVTASDNHGGASTRTFTLQVRDKNITTVYVNFNQTLPADAPWNNFNSYPGANAAIANLADETGTLSGIRIQLLDGFTGTNTVGSTTGNNSGVYPDNVLASNYYTSEATARRIRISNLNATYRYNLIFLGSRQGNDNKNTEYTVGSSTVTLNAANNTRNTVQINGISPDASGNIDFTVKQATGAAYGYINSVVIQYYLDNGTPLAPGNATALAKSKTSIQLNWLDNSNNETGFEVWRSTDKVNYTLRATVGNNVNTYTDNGLGIDTRYYYKVRALKAAIQSDFSNIATAATFRNAVYINFNVFNPAGAPWNNTNSAPAQGLEFPNLKDDNNENTGMTMVIHKAFTGDNPYGMNTGNNSGIYPDNVISSTYWVDINESGQLKIKGLNLAKKYNFVFFASRDGAGDRTSIYTINGQMVSLNAGYNINQTTQINDVSPDQNGEVLISVTAGGQSIYGYIGALVIQSYTPEASQIDPDLILQKAANNKGEQILETSVKIDKTYPNPFISNVNVEIISDGKSQNNFILNVTDVSGRSVHTKMLGKLPAGTHRVLLDMGSNRIPGGLYLLQLVDGSKIVNSTKLIKSNY